MTKRFTTFAVVGVTGLLVAGAVWFAIAAGPGSGAMSGVVVKDSGAAVRAVDQLGAHDSIKVAQVTAPDDSWLVAYRIGMEGMPGALLGYVHVAAGTSSDVDIPIDPSIRLTPLAIVSLNADRGVRGRFEFDMARFDESPDKPYYVGGQAVQTTITVAFAENGNSIDVGPPTMTTP